MDLFLSHVEEDARLVKELGDALEAEGYSTWNYTKDSEPVIAHQAQTGRAIEESAAFVLVVSPRSLEHVVHVDREVSCAAELGKPFVPLLIDVPFAEFAERQPVWEAALRGAVALAIPPEGPAAIVPAIVRSLRQLGIQPSIPTVALGVRTSPEDASHEPSDVALSYFDEHFLPAIDVADGLETAGYRVWYYERDFLRGRKSPDVRTEDGETSGRQSDASPIAALTDQVLQDAVQRSAAEIYIEPRGPRTAILFRLDGVASEVMQIPRELHVPLVAHVKAIAMRGGQDARLGISTTRTEHGEKVMIRLADNAYSRRVFARSNALLLFCRRDDSGRDQLPLDLEGLAIAGKPILLIEPDARRPDAQGPPAGPLPADTIRLAAPDGITPAFVTDLVTRLKACGLMPGRQTMRLQLVLGDITEQNVDAIVNAANATLLGGGGVDGAIHRRGGPQILEECKRLRRERYPDGLPTGEAVATTGGRLPAAWVIHTVGPVFRNSANPAGELAACYRNSLRVADELEARSIAFPAISTGAFGYPVDQAAQVAVEAVRGARPRRIELVRFVVFDRASYDAYEREVRSTQ